MRLMKRNLKPVYFCLYQGQRNVVDGDGYETGEKRIIYSDPYKQLFNVSPASGAVQMELFGVIENYDKILITDNMQCPINENTVLYVDEMPERNVTLALQFPVIPAEDFGTTIRVKNPYQYVVKRVAKSLHHISYAVSKVTVS